MLRGTRRFLLGAAAAVGRLRRVLALRLRTALDRARNASRSERHSAVARSVGVARSRAAAVDAARSIAGSNVARCVLEVVASRAGSAAHAPRRRVIGADCRADLRKPAAAAVLLDSVAVSTSGKWMDARVASIPAAP